MSQWPETGGRRKGTKQNKNVKVSECNFPPTLKKTTASPAQWARARLQTSKIPTTADSQKQGFPFWGQQWRGAEIPSCSSSVSFSELSSSKNAAAFPGCLCEDNGRCAMTEVRQLPSECVCTCMCVCERRRWYGATAKLRLNVRSVFSFGCSAATNVSWAIIRYYICSWGCKALCGMFL